MRFAETFSVAMKRSVLYFAIARERPECPAIMAREVEEASALAL